MKRRSPEWWASQRPETVGKETEKIVEEVLNQFNSRWDFAYHRLPDSKSARGALAAQPADFIVSAGRGGFLEVKAVKHSYRLSRDSVRQLPLLKKFEMAGTPSTILVFHYLENIWRVARPADLTAGAPSWDLRPLPTYITAEGALRYALFGEE